MTEVMVISAGLSQPSSTRLLADRLAAAVGKQLPEAGIETVALREFAHDITDHMLVGFPSARLKEVLDKVTTADGLILVTPTFSASYSGLFKSFMDIIDPETLRGMPTVLAATGGTERHSLMLEHAMRPLLSYVRAATIPTAVYAASSDWGTSAELSERIDRAAGELSAAIGRGGHRPAADLFAEPVPFTELLNHPDRD